MKKITVCTVVVVAILIIVSLLGCQSKGSLGKEDSSKGASMQDTKGIPIKLENPNVTFLTAADGPEGFAEAVKLFEEKYDGKVNFMIAVLKDWSAKLAAAVSSGEPPDLIFWTQMHMPLYAIRGIVQPIEPYFDLKDPLWADDIEAMNDFKYAGKYYGVAKSINPMVLFYNEDAFTNNGLKTPLELYKTGKWDWKSLEDAARALTQDMDRDGNIDQYGFHVGEKGIFALTDGAYYFVFEDNGGIKLTMNDPKIIEGIQFYQDAVYKYKYMDPKMDPIVGFSSGKLAMCAVTIDFIAKQGVKDNVKFKWDIAPMPAASADKKSVGFANSQFWGIPTGAANAQGAATLAYICSTVGRGNQDEKLAENYSQEQINLYKEICKHVVMRKHQGIGSFNNQLTAMFKEIDAGKPVVSMIAQYSPLLQAEIDAVMQGIK